MARTASDTKTISFVVDGQTYSTTVPTPQVPVLNSLADAMSAVNQDEKKLLSIISRGFVASLVGDLRKNAKRQWIAENDPNREMIRKQANVIFASWALQKYGEPTTRKALKARDKALAERAYNKALAKAREMFGSSTIDLGAE